MQTKCPYCGGTPELCSEDSPFTVECDQCGISTLAWAYENEAWQHWEKIARQEKIMKQWDYWRAEIANGHTGAAARDWFESILDHYEEKLKEVNEKKPKWRGIY